MSENAKPTQLRLEVASSTVAYRKTGFELSDNCETAQELYPADVSRQIRPREVGGWDRDDERCTEVSRGGLNAVPLVESCRQDYLLASVGFPFELTKPFASLEYFLHLAGLPSLSIRYRGSVVASIQRIKSRELWPCRSWASSADRPFVLRRCEVK